MKLFDLSGRKAIVTGGTRGLGFSMAEALLEAGAEVVIVGASASVHEVADEFSSRGHACQGAVIDLADKQQRRDGFDAALETLGGRLDILVNAAGLQRRHPSEAFPIDEWEAVLEVNLTAVFELCQLAANVMLEQGQGKIINIASLLSFFGGITVPAYAASKGGVMQLTKALANEWASRGINVNALAPGYMATDMNTALLADETRNAEITARIPAKRWGSGDDMKGPLLFLASSAADYVHGVTLPVDGGYLGR
ncbi:SDR family NAD(P)-dependent oxidoreductase [Halomonas sp. HP20-15]|uniref:SDR family NAD(P)-dependent oxidoreductase n=1 Tax=Halomonas sp. HP20-15 TaxID=3085901 RepID=UPI0029814403|nr:SDR family NAD(P)-dependent oxidoreductase [Halomonas sp. HP20-15]MDW5375403.1 SDR family NAD(P)-dependent oxidoreductase [Halomonas sp. HP20-15]